jgi:hypothetical protein
VLARRREHGFEHARIARAGAQDGAERLARIVAGHAADGTIARFFSSEGGLLWRIWIFLCGLPVGAAAALAIARTPSAAGIAIGALAAGAALVAIASLLARDDDEPDRGLHLANAASAGFAGLAAAAAVAFDWAPQRWFWVAAAIALLVAFLWAGLRAPGPAGGPARWALRALLAASIGFIVVLGIAAASAGLLARTPEPNARLSAALYAVDAGVVTRPFPVCAAAPKAVGAPLADGAHPALTPDGRFLYFDARVDAEGGRRQIQRLDRASGRVQCVTCGEDGNNQRPSVSASGVSLVFETDRHASRLHPDDTEIYLAAVTPPDRDAEAGRRLTFSTTPDERPIFGPGPTMLTWSRREGGRYRVVAAAIRSGHGGILLGSIGTLADGGAQWIAPIAWGADARSLVVARGNPFAAQSGALIDPTTGETRALGDDLAPAASLDGDGGWIALAATRSRHTAGVLPRWLGFALAPWAHAVDRRAPLRDETALRLGPAADPASAQTLALDPAVAAWGEPTGLAYAPDASALVLGQRDAGGAERLLWIDLDCTQTATAPREIPAPRRGMGMGGM